MQEAKLLENKNHVLRQPRETDAPQSVYTASSKNVPQCIKYSVRLLNRNYSCHDYGETEQEERQRSRIK